MAKFELILLGTGTPLPSPDRCGAGQILVTDEGAIMVDCGWGASRRAMASGVPIMGINTIFFTHMHSDHITDLPDFIIMRWTGGATAPLHIYGPEGTRQMVEGFRSGLEPDVKFRFAHHGEKMSSEGVECIVHEVPATPQPSEIAQVAGMAVASFEVDHFPVVPALGFSVSWRGHRIVLSGDTKKCESLVRAASGADVLVSEVLHLGMMEQRISALRAAGNDRLAEILVEACDYHSPTADVGAMATAAGVQRLVLTHVIPPVPPDGPQIEAIVAGVRETYAGEVVAGRDLQRIVIAEEA